MTRIEKLLSISSEAIVSTLPDNTAIIEDFPLGAGLHSILKQKNGFYAFESALHVFPLTDEPVNGANLAEWNSPSLWRDDYGVLTQRLLFFAEDVFQDQFCLSSNGVLRFKAETGGTTPVADSLEGWADHVIRNYDQVTGWTFAKKWQAENGPLPPGKRLMPKIPFFLGGPYAMDNLWAGDAVEGMRFKADIAMQTRNMADGTTVRMVFRKKPAN